MLKGGEPRFGMRSVGDEWGSGRPTHTTWRGKRKKNKLKKGSHLTGKIKLKKGKKPTLKSKIGEILIVELSRGSFDARGTGSLAKIEKT